MRPCALAHVDGGACWRCGDQRPWWAEARAKAGVELWVAPPALEPIAIRGVHPSWKAHKPGWEGSAATGHVAFSRYQA